MRHSSVAEIRIRKQMPKPVKSTGKLAVRGRGGTDKANRNKGTKSLLGCYVETTVALLCVSQISLVT